MWLYLIECVVSNYGFLLVSDHAGRFGHSFINCLASDILCPFHKKLKICEMCLVSSQTDNPGFSFIIYYCCIVIEEL